MMADSNQFHATCLDTAPPIFYMNDVSRQVIGVVERMNAANGTPVAGYTFDAGPNAVIITRKQDVGAVLRKCATPQCKCTYHDDGRELENGEACCTKCSCGHACKSFRHLTRGRSRHLACAWTLGSSTRASLRSPSG